MPLREIEFELSAIQYERMGYPGLRQGQPVSVILDGGLLLPEPAAHGWFAVRPERIAPRLVRTAPAHYAIAGQIKAAEIDMRGDVQSAVVVVECDDVPVRVGCGPREDGALPFGAWETRYLWGSAFLEGIFEDDFAVPIGEPVGVTIWHFARLVLRPGDPHFGEWVESDTLPPQPFEFDRIVVTARVHRRV